MTRTFTPLISVIIPTYNRCRLLKFTIESILSQTYDDIELLIIDDGSDDPTNEMIESLHDSRIRYFNIGRTKDIAKVRNFGLNASTGEYIAFCDDDDLWVKDKLEKQLKYIPEYDFVCCQARIIDSQGRIVDSERIANSGKVRTLRVQELLLGNSVITSSVLLKKVIMKRGFIEKHSTTSAEDYELWLYLAENNKILVIDEPLVHLRRHQNTSSFDYGSKYVSLLKSVIDVLNQYKFNKGSDIKRYARYSLVKQRKELCKVLLHNSLYSHFAIECALFLKELLHFSMFSMYLERKQFKKKLSLFGGVI